MRQVRPAVSGIGGTFIYARDPGALLEWYERHLGISTKEEEGVRFRVFSWRRAEDGAPRSTTWSILAYEGQPGTRPTAMFNYHVDDLAALVEALSADGLDVTDIQDEPYGRFAWLSDPEGNRIELYQEAQSAPTN